NGTSDIVLLKYDSKGALSWAKQIGGKGAEQVALIAFDGQGNVMLAGLFGGTSDFGTGPLTSQAGSAPANLNITAHWDDAFIAKYAPDGKALASRRYGSDGLDTSRGLLAVGDSDAWLWVEQSPVNAVPVSIVFRVRFDAASMMHPPTPVDEAFTR